MQNGLAALILVYDKNILKPDLDCDGLIDSNDPDIDGDGVNNRQDAFPRNRYETKDSDGDGIGDNADSYDNRIDLPNFYIYEDVDSNRGQWSSAIGSPSRYYVPDRGTGALDIKDGVLYKLKLHNSQYNAIAWDIKTDNIYSIYIKTKVRNKNRVTYRILHYYPNRNTLGLKKNGYIDIGLGDIQDNAWHTIRRDIIKDLHDYDPDSTLLSIEEFWIRGKSLLDNIEMLNYRLYEDGSSDGNWNIYGKKNNAYSTIVFDKSRNSRVVKLQGNGLKTGFALTPFFNTKQYSTIQWSMCFEEDFIVYIKVVTNNGVRYLVYTNKNNDEGEKENSNYIYFGLGRSIVKNGWQTITRNLNEDLQKFESGSHILSVTGFLVRGSGLIDDVSLLISQKVEHDPVYSHNHYAMDVSGLTSVVDSHVYDLYVYRLAGRHHLEKNAQEAVVLFYKKKSDKKWKNEIIVRAQIGIGITNTNLSEHPYDSDKVVLRYDTKEVLNGTIQAFHHLKIFDLKKHRITKSLILKNVPSNILIYGNTLFTPTGHILLAGYGGKVVKLYRSTEAFDDFVQTYTMEEVAHFEKSNEIFLEPVLSYVFDKLTVAIRKDIVWFNERDNQEELYSNTKGELRYIDDLEGGDINTVWNKKVLGVEIHGMYMPAYQPNHFLMIASNGGNRQKILTVNSNDASLNTFQYNKNAFTISCKSGGGYPTAIRNEDEFFVLFWEETNDLRKTKIKVMGNIKGMSKLFLRKTKIRILQIANSVTVQNAPNFHCSCHIRQCRSVIVQP
jgi:hypothetical protein